MLLIHIYLTTRYQGKMSEGQQLTQELLKMTLTCPLSLFYENPWQTALSEQEKEDNLSSTWKMNKWHSACSLSTAFLQGNYTKTDWAAKPCEPQVLIIASSASGWMIWEAAMMSTCSSYGFTAQSVFLLFWLVILKIFSQIETTGSLKASGVCGWA